jgi:phosphatidylserine/phosphatidylglycerophosphate/cardiolipin synthase-like enzyme
MPERLALIARAQRSIWMSSLTCPHRDVVDALAKKARDGVEVNLVVADRKCGPAEEGALEQLERAGVEWDLVPSTHSKVLVIDELIVMNGSANAHGGHHDINHVFEDRNAALETISELRRLIDD